MVVHAQDRRSQAPALPCHQRRRIRARDLQGPRDHAQRPAHAGRRRIARLIRHGRARSLHLRARRIHQGARKSRGRSRGGLRGQSHRPGQYSRLAIRSLCPSWRGGIYLRRRDGDARIAGGQEGHAAHEAALSRRYGTLRFPHHGQQCRVDRRRADDFAARRIVVHEFRRPQQFRHQGLQRLRSRQQAVQRRRGDVDPVPRID